MPQQQSRRGPSQGFPVGRRNGQHSILVLLGFKKVAEHIDELRLFYLIGCAYHDGAKSFRKIAAMLRTPPSDDRTECDYRMRVGGKLAKSLRAIHHAIAALEKLTGVQVVNRTGEGLGYDGLTQSGERLWQQTAAFLREYGP